MICNKKSNTLDNIGRFSQRYREGKNTISLMSHSIICFNDIIRCFGPSKNIKNDFYQHKTPNAAGILSFICQPKSGAQKMYLKTRLCDQRV